MNIGSVLARGFQTYTEAKARQQAREDALRQQAFANLMAEQAGARAQSGLDLTRKGQEYAQGRDVIEDLWRAGGVDRAVETGTRLAEQSQAVKRAEDLLESQRQARLGLGPFLPSLAPASFKEKTAPVTDVLLDALSRVAPQQEGPAPWGALQEAALHPSPEQSLLAPLIERMKSQQPVSLVGPGVDTQGQAGRDLEASRRPTATASMDDLLGAIAGKPFTYEDGRIVFAPPEPESPKDRAGRLKTEAETRKIGREVEGMDVSDDLKRAQTSLTTANAELKELEALGYEELAAIKRAKLVQDTNTAYASELLNIERAKKTAVEAGNIPEVTRLRVAELKLDAWYKGAQVDLSAERNATAAYSATTGRMNANTSRMKLAPPKAGGLTPEQQKISGRVDARIRAYPLLAEDKKPAERHEIAKMLYQLPLTPEDHERWMSYVPPPGAAGTPGAASSGVAIGGRVTVPKP